MDNFTAQELDKKYHGTYCELLIQGVRVPSYVEAIRQSDTNNLWHVKLARLGDNGAGLQIEHQPVREVEFLPTPNKKLLLMGNIPLVFTKNPKRQWRRGLCDGNVEFSFALRSLFQSGNFRDVGQYPSRKMTYEPTIPNFPSLVRSGIDPEKAAALFSPNHVRTIAQGIEYLAKNEKCLGVPLCDEFLLSHSPYEDKDKDYLLFYFDSPIASYSSKRNCLYVLNPHYLQEIMDFNNRRQCGVRIEE